MTYYIFQHNGKQYQVSDNASESQLNKLPCEVLVKYAMRKRIAVKKLLIASILRTEKTILPHA